MTRRQAVKAAAVAIASAAATPSAAQDTAPKPPDIPVDSRLAQIEAARGKPLSDSERKAVLDNIRDQDASWRQTPTFVVPDGTEPDFVFTPTPLVREERGHAR